jgi:hypothetical protein
MPEQSGKFGIFWQNQLKLPAVCLNRYGFDSALFVKADLCVAQVVCDWYW